MTELLKVPYNGGTVELEYAWLNETSPGSSLGDSTAVVVFLHEGLGSVAMWRDFPLQLCRLLGLRGLVYSRPGYGRSTPRAAREHWPADYLQRQAQLLHTVLASVEISQPVLFGHSDGASIALLYAAAFRGKPRAVIALAPHSFVEPLALSSIAQARRAYQHGSLRARLAPFHADVDSAFYGWNNVWLSAAFASFDCRPLLASISCPLLVVQGATDEYGSLAQVHAVRNAVPQAQACVLPGAGHAPHARRDASCAALLARVAQFAASLDMPA